MTSTEREVRAEVEAIVRQARVASRAVARAGTAVKNAALAAMAEELDRARGEILAANAKDLQRGREQGVKPAFLDRLSLDDARIDGMMRGLAEVAALPDPVGEVVRMWRRPNGLRVGRMRIPLGVIGIVYEARPNVTVETASLCLKAGNACVLKGGSDAIHSNLALAAVLGRALERAGLPTDAVQLVPSTDRAAVSALLEADEFVDVIIPRGGESLIRFVAEHSRIPVIKHYKGTCHVYVDEGADLDMATAIVLNGKCQRPSVCNAVETLLVDSAVAASHLVPLAAALADAGVELRGCVRTQALLPGVRPATEEDWSAEYLDLTLAVRIVDGIDEAMAHIARYGSDHTETIVTRDYARAQRFLAEVNSSVVMVNASTRFADGGELGLGSEIGISTTKLHAFGPMGLEELTTLKFIVYGEGQVRG